MRLLQTLKASLNVLQTLNAFTSNAFAPLKRRKYARARRYVGTFFPFFVQKEIAQM